MLRGLLVYSLERIASLQHFYELENENIMCKSADGMKINWFGYCADRYFAALAASHGEETDEIKNLRARLDTYIDVIRTDPNDNAVEYRLKRADVLRERGYELDIKKASLKYRQYADMPIIHGGNTLIMLITRFEEFISHFLATLYRMFPQKYLDNQSITFSEISGSSIDEVKDAIVARQVDAIMRDSYKEWFKILGSHKMSFKEYEAELNTLEEVYARRNILVHNSGRVNETYLKLIKNSKYKIGETLQVDEEYLTKAFNAINVLIFAIIIEAVKLISLDKNEYLQDIFSEAFGHLSEEKYHLCSKVYRALMDSKYLDAMHKMMSTVNYWISMIELSGMESVRKEIEAFDTSALNPMFELARIVLLQDYDSAEYILKSLYERKDINANMLETWPLFKKFRATDQYTRFKGEHADDFKVVTFELNVESTHEDDESAETEHGRVLEECCCNSIDNIDEPVNSEVFATP